MTSLERYLNQMGGRDLTDVKHDSQGSYILMFNGKSGEYYRDPLPDVSVLERFYS